MLWMQDLSLKQEMGKQFISQCHLAKNYGSALVFFPKNKQTKPECELHIQPKYHFKTKSKLVTEPHFRETGSVSVCVYLSVCLLVTAWISPCSFLARIFRIGLSFPSS